MSTIPMFVAAFWLADPSFAADVLRNPSQTLSSAATAGNEAELDEVLVEGRRPETDTQKLRYWMDRLVGEFRYEGHVERLSGDSVEMSRAEVQGKSRCVQFGKAAAVQCQINVTWPEIRGRDGAPVPGGVSSLTHAVEVYSLDIRAKNVGYFSVGNDGVATSSKGWLLDDTLIARSPCADFSGKCERVVRLEAPPDAKVIRMRVDLERDGEVELRYSFQWNRVAQETPVVIAAEALPESAAAPPVPGRASSGVPPAVDSWLRGMAGEYRVTPPRLCRFVRGADKAAGCTEWKADEAVATRRGPVEARCQGIGAGPGVRCVVHMEWPESGIPPKRPGKDSTPMFWLYGFDPIQRGIAKLLVLPTVDTVGASELFEGQLREGELTQCSNQTCNIRAHEVMAPGGEWIRFVSVSAFFDKQRGEATAWRMYRIVGGLPVESENLRRAPTNRSPGK